MLLLILSTLEAIIISIVGAIAFFMFGSYFGRRNFKTINSDHQSLISEHQNLQKQYKARQKGIVRLEQDRDSAIEKFKDLQTELDSYKANEAESKVKYAKLENEVISLQGDKEKTSRTIADLQKRLDSANQKFITNQKDSKSWRNELDTIKRSEKDLRLKLNSSINNNRKLTSKLENLSSAEAELAQLRLDVKAFQKEIKRVTKDCQYWEKQHYDTHHKLAASLESIEGLKSEVQNSKLEKQGLEIKEENMLKSLADLKKKLIYANERYHNLSQEQAQNN